MSSATLIVYVDQSKICKSMVFLVRTTRKYSLHCTEYEYQSINQARFPSSRYLKQNIHQIERNTWNTTALGPQLERRFCFYV
jgi:hypothetical protein